MCIFGLKMFCASWMKIRKKYMLLFIKTTNQKLKIPKMDIRKS